MRAGEARHGVRVEPRRERLRSAHVSCAGPRTSSLRPRCALPESRSLLEASATRASPAPGHAAGGAGRSRHRRLSGREGAARLLHVSAEGREGHRLIGSSPANLHPRANRMFSRPRLSRLGSRARARDRSDDRPRRRLSAALRQRAGGRASPSTCCVGASLRADGPDRGDREPGPEARVAVSSCAAPRAGRRSPSPRTRSPGISLPPARWFAGDARLPSPGG